MNLSALLLLISFSVIAKDILFIGDSHTAGPFGKNIHRLLSKDHNIVTLGHSSSAPIHWLGDNDYKLSGGAFNQLSLNNRTYFNPNPIHWRVKVNVPKLLPLLTNASYHSEWPLSFKPDLVVIALGANDARAISDNEGNIRHSSYLQRETALLEMLSTVKGKCIWIGPPNGVKKSQANQNFLYEFLEKNISSQCPFMNSNHYYVKGCDGIHMNCSSELDNAMNWALEVRAFIHNNI